MSCDYRALWSSTDISTIMWACQGTTIEYMYASYRQDKRKWLSAGHFVPLVWISENIHSSIFQNKNID